MFVIASMRIKVMVSLPPSLLKRLDEKAKKEERTRSEVIRQALEKQLSDI